MQLPTMTSRRPRPAGAVLLLALALAACGDDTGAAGGAGGDAATTSSSSATAASSTASSTGSSTAAQGGGGAASSTASGDGAGGAGAGGAGAGGDAVGGGGGASAPLLADALDCGAATSVGGLAAGNDASRLVRVALDVAVFPDALCNDGSPAIAYVRTSVTEAGRDRWVIQLQGGGSCSTPDACAGRWCNEGTNFSKTQMTSTTSPVSIDGAGILARAPDVEVASGSPFADFNHVFVKYCSSDLWLGTNRDVAVDAAHPVSGAPLTYRAHFLGRRILEAVLSTLRGEGVPLLRIDGEAMPDLDAAELVVFAGASAGGVAIVNLLDDVQAALAGIEVVGLTDSTFGPELGQVGFDRSLLCTELGLCSAEEYLEKQDQDQVALWAPTRDASCIAAHAGEEWACVDDTFVLTNHVTTPFFMRMGLVDDNISGPFVGGGLTDAQGVTFDLARFAQVVRQQALDLASIQETAIEGDAIGTVPGAFAPRCAKHETLRSTPDTFAVTIAAPDAQPVAMFDAWSAWRAGSAAIVTAGPGSTSVCP